MTLTISITLSLLLGYYLHKYKVQKPIRYYLYIAVFTHKGHKYFKLGVTGDVKRRIAEHEREYETKMEYSYYKSSKSRILLVETYLKNKYPQKRSSFGGKKGGTEVRKYEHYYHEVIRDIENNFKLK